MGDRKYRMETTENERAVIMNAIAKCINENLLPESNKTLRKLYFRMRDSVASEATQKQKEAIARATEARREKARKKIENAVNQLRLENKPITMYAVAKYGKVSPNTARKYRDFIEQAERDRQRSQSAAV